MTKREGQNKYSLEFRHEDGTKNSKLEDWSGIINTWVIERLGMVDIRQ